MIVDLEVSTARLRRLLSDLDVQLSDDVVLRLTSDTLRHELTLDVVTPGARRMNERPRDTVKVEGGYL